MKRLLLILALCCPAWATTIGSGSWTNVVANGWTLTDASGLLSVVSSSGLSMVGSYSMQYAADGTHLAYSTGTLSTGSQTNVYYRIYFRTDKVNQGGFLQFFSGGTTGNYPYCRLTNDNPAKINCLYGAAGVTSAAAIAANTTYYIEVHAVNSATVGGIELRINGGTAVSSLSSNTSAYSQSSVVVGNFSGTPLANGSHFYYDQVDVSAVGWLGAGGVGELFSNGFETGNFSGSATNVWYAPVTIPTQVTRNGTLATAEASQAALTANYEWWYDGSTNLYVYTSTNPTSDGSAWVAQAFYYMRGDGTAANKASATSCGAASSAMNIGTFNAATFSPSDTVTMCDSGGLFTDNVMLPQNSGTAGNPITITNSGSPVIDGADVVTTWTVYSGNVWQATIPARNMNWSLASGTVFCVYRDGLWMGPPVAILGQLVADGDWLWSSGAPTTIYVYSNVNPNSHLMQVGNRDVGIFANGNSYLTINGLTIQHANEGWGIEVSAVNSISIAGTVITNYTSIRNGNGAFSSYVTNGLTNTGITISGLTDIHSGIINQSAAAGSINATFSGTGALSNVSISNCQVSYYAVSDIAGALQKNQAGIDLNAVTNGTISGCQVDHGSQSGIVLASGTTGITVSDNLIFSNGSASNATAGYNEGIYVSSTSSTNTLQANVIANNFGAGISFQAGTALRGYNNTLFGNGSGFLLGVSGATLKNNIVAQSTNTEITTSASVTLTSDYNDWYHSAGGNFMNYQGTAGTFAQWKTASSGDAHSISSNPNFINAGSNNFGLTSGPAVNAGTNLGSTYQYGLSPASSWPSSIVTLKQNFYGDEGWDIGAYVLPRHCKACDMSRLKWPRLEWKGSVK